MKILANSIKLRLSVTFLSRFFFAVCITICGIAQAQKNQVEKTEQEWLPISAENTVYLEIDTGLVVIELAPFMTPQQVQRFVDLVNEGFYDNTDFYRVIDGFVAQGGDMSEAKKTMFRDKMPPEFTRKIPKPSAFFSLQKPALLAPETGFLHGFPAGRDTSTNEEWLLHCPGTVAFARSNEAEWVTPDFYIVIGQAPRHLDRNMSTLGRVVYGMPAVQQIKRANADAAGGVITEVDQRTKIISAKMGNKVASDKRLAIYVQNQLSESAINRISSSRSRENEFFHFKGNGNLDACYYRPRIKIGE
ncbi:peptidylprolyl isomerase [Glaciecola petra]|uniref:peptidylprolyl isomerase n=1 Tax=Glaciecola petra TaxID=3075602 RepID=A0ABU2ZU79_9ALTE|nr:peptidylprolyl isomerase [Aestuariibacter sp. P117]MDT0595598.1 peptidylprolyl isomerase [Aestuariibacter sp. P117]